MDALLLGWIVAALVLHWPHLWVVCGSQSCNVLVQPFWLYLFAACAYKMAMALVGRVVYGWRVVKFQMPEDLGLYRAMRWHCIGTGLAGCFFAAGLGWLFFQPLL